VGVGAVRVGGASDPRVEFTVRLHRRGGSPAVARLLRARGHGGWVFMAWRVGEGGSRGSTPYKVAVWARMGDEARRPIANQGRRCARTAATPLGGRRGGRARGAQGEGQEGGSTRAAPRRTDRRVVGCLDVRSRGNRGGRTRHGAGHAFDAQAQNSAAYPCLTANTHDF
jgi:hypothetical protein